MEFHVNNHMEIVSSSNLERILHLFLGNLQSLNEGQVKIMAGIADVVAALGAEHESIAHISDLLTTIHTELLAAQASADPAAIQAVLDLIAADKATIDATVVANPDPAAVVAPPEPPADPPTV